MTDDAKSAGTNKMKAPVLAGIIGGLFLTTLLHLSNWGWHGLMGYNGSHFGIYAYSYLALMLTGFIFIGALSVFLTADHGVTRKKVLSSGIVSGITSGIVFSSLFLYSDIFLNPANYPPFPGDFLKLWTFFQGISSGLSILVGIVILTGMIAATLGALVSGFLQQRLGKTTGTEEDGVKNRNVNRTFIFSLFTVIITILIIPPVIVATGIDQGAITREPFGPAGFGSAGLPTGPDQPMGDDHASNVTRWMQEHAGQEVTAGEYLDITNPGYLASHSQVVRDEYYRMKIRVPDFNNPDEGMQFGNRSVAIAAFGYREIPGDLQPESPQNPPVPVWSDQTGIREVLVQCSGDGKYVVSGSDTGVLRMYDRTGTILWTFRREGKMVRSIAISRSGDYVGAVFLNPDAPSMYADGEILFFNRTGSVLWDYTRDYTVERIAISDDGNSIYASGSPGLYSFDRNGTIIGQNESQGRTWVLEVAGNGSYAIAGGTIMERVHIANSQTPANRIYAVEKDGTIAWNYSTKHAINSIGISMDAGTIVNAAGYELSSFTRNGTLIWQMKSGPDISSVAVSADGEYTVAGTRYSLRLFNRTGTLLWKYEDSPGISSLGISDDRDVIVAGASDGIYIFDRAGKMLWHYGTPKSVLHVSVATNGMFFAAGTSDTSYFFNRWGNATIIDEPERSVMGEDIPAFLVPAPLLSPTRPAPLPATLVILAISGIVIIAAIRKQRRE